MEHGPQPKRDFCCGFGLLLSCFDWLVAPAELPALMDGSENASRLEQNERMPMRPSDALTLKRALVREATARYRTANPRVFGSVLHGNDQEGSDLDLLVDALPGATLFDLGGLQDELQTVLGVQVDVLTPADLPARFRAQVLAQAQPV